MKKTILFILTILLFTEVKSQEKSKTQLEYNLKSVQIGYLYLALNDETRLARKLSLKTGLSFSPYKYRSGGYKNDYIVYPYLNLETRWYSNLDRRAEKNKKIQGNTGNIWSLKAIYSPNYIILTNLNNPDKNSLVSIGPYYTIRRTLGKNFDIEGNIGGDYGYIINSNKNYFSNHGSYFSYGAGIKLGFHFTTQ